MNLTFGERHIVKGIDPVADFNAGTVHAGPVNVADYHAARFIYYKGVGATGTAKLQLEACDNANGDNPVAVPFAYQKYAGADDVPADVVQTTAADGVTTTAGSSELYVLEAETQRLPEGKTWLRLKGAEVADDPIVGAVLIELLKPRYAAQVPETVKS